MDLSYLRQLRTDSNEFLIPVLTLVTAVIALLSFEFALEDVGRLFLSILLAYLNLRLARRWLRTEKQEIAGLVFVTGNILILAFILSQSAFSATFIPYLMGVFVVAASTLIEPVASLLVWLLTTIAIFVAIWVNPADSSISQAGNFGLPVGINLLLALVAYLMTIEWQIAVDEVSSVQRRAQSRRDELFEMKESLSQANARLHALNEELEQARQTAVAERDLRTRFMNNVSHELRTPLNTIVNFAHILAGSAYGSVNETQQDYLQRIEQSGWHSLAVLNDLMDMAQIEAGEFRLHIETADLYQICEDAMATIRGLILDKEIELVRDYPVQWPPLQLDKMRLKQALINLLGNAAKYTEQGYIALRVQPQADQVTIIVEDTGIGIAPEHHERVFQEFRQLDETAARRRIGTGLGLPITRHLIERHGGGIRLEGDIGVGSKFILTLPIAPAAAI